MSDIAAHSNRGFWKIVLALAVGGVLLIGSVFAFRPVARSGAVAYAQSNLRRAADAAERLAETGGSLAAADRAGMASVPEVDDLLFIDPDQSSNDSEIVSVLAGRESWTGAARADTGDCYWVRLDVTGEQVLGTGTDCSGDQAALAEPTGWPDP